MTTLLIHETTEMSKKSHLSTLLQSRMLTKPSLLLEKLSKTLHGAISPVPSAAISCSNSARWSSERRRHWPRLRHGIMVYHHLPPITTETDYYVIPGKPYSVALNDDLSEVTSVLKYYGGYADKIHGQVIETSPTKLAYTIREPV